ncbi:hypothetical protein [Mycobacteroides abscessus]|uniref:Uncharacterized protein n=1 Tax=Mycobacteroides abscessus TaxID=36809 RepID=A0A0U0ZR25_9MYCO|nr:hypothetical protein [Mycobacteroides abscessus]CPV66303.1 Uncharacterised protein [Mycobacteroides abscessus]
MSIMERPSTDTIEPPRPPLDYREFTTEQLAAALRKSDLIDPTFLAELLEETPPDCCPHLRARLAAGELKSHWCRSIYDSYRHSRLDETATRYEVPETGFPEHVAKTLNRLGYGYSASILVGLIAVICLFLTPVIGTNALALGSVTTMVLSAIGLGVLYRRIEAIRIANMPAEYDREEQQYLDASVADWPEHESCYAKSLPDDMRLRQDFFTGKGIRSGVAALVWREPHLVAISQLIADDIVTSDTWLEHDIRDHRARVDLVATLDDIRLRAHRIWRTNINGYYDAEPPVQVQRAAETAWEVLVHIVGQLADYSKALHALDALTRQRQALYRQDRAGTPPMAGLTALLCDASTGKPSTDLSRDLMQIKLDWSRTLRRREGQIRKLNREIASGLRELHATIWTPTNLLKKV